MAKMGRKGWKHELELKRLAKLCEKTLLRALNSKKVSEDKKIEIAKAILPRFVPKDVNFTASGSIDHRKIVLITSDIDGNNPEMIDIEPTKAVNKDRLATKKSKKGANKGKKGANEPKIAGNVYNHKNESA